MTTTESLRLKDLEPHDERQQELQGGARTGRNPQTGEKLDIPSRSVTR